MGKSIAGITIITLLKQVLRQYLTPVKLCRLGGSANVVFGDTEVTLKYHGQSWQCDGSKENIELVRLSDSLSISLYVDYDNLVTMDEEGFAKRQPVVVVVRDRNGELLASNARQTTRGDAVIEPSIAVGIHDLVEELICRFPTA